MRADTRSSSPGLLCSLRHRRADAEHRVALGDRFELLQRSVPIDGKVSARSRSHLQVAPQDRRALTGFDVLEANTLAATMPKHRRAAVGANVADAVRLAAEHRHEIALAPVLRG